jgi:hypothetical protein
MKRILIYCILLTMPLALYGQDIALQAEYPSAVEEGQQFSVAWTVNTGGGEFAAPSFEGFYKLMGPQTSYSSNTQIINGKVSRQTSYSYIYYLQALKEGKYVIPPAAFTYKNKTFYSDSIRIEVIGTGVQQSNVQQGTGEQLNDTRVESGGKELFADLNLSRREVYIGESITAGIKIYTRVNLGGITEIKYPDFTGFMKTDLETPPLNSLKQESINGTVYGTGLIQQFLLYPQVSGEITIAPVQLTILVQQKSGQSDPFFGDFFSGYQNLPKAVVSKPVTIKVKPLPGAKPDDFSGVVGKLEMKSSVNKDSVDINDAVNFKIIISGTGNLKIAEAPTLKLSSDIEVYDPKVTDNIKNSASGTTGQKSFEYLLIPRHYGDYTIPSVTYSYFNTSTGKYDRLSTDEFHFHARKGTEQAAGITVYGGISREDVKYVGQDIRFIKTNPGKLMRSANVIISKRSFYSAFGFAFLIFLSVLFVRREHIRRNSDISAVKTRKAGKMAALRLKTASGCMKHNEMDRFYEEILKALWGYLSDKLNIPLSDLNRGNVITVLKDKGVGDDLLNKLTSILDSCEYARFAPSAAGSGPHEIYEGASSFIKAMENSIE